VRLASAVLPAVDEDGEVTVPLSISQEHRELFARAQRWVTMSDADIEVRFQMLPPLGLSSRAAPYCSACESSFLRSECTTTYWCL
jgi:hypothetical protein